MIETKSKLIDGVTVQVTSLTATRSYKVFNVLAKALGPALLKALSGAKSTEEMASGGLSLGSIDVTGLADGVGILLDRLSPGEWDALVKELFETAYIIKDGKQLPFMQVFEIEFAGKLFSLFKAVQFAVEVNYGDFLGVLRGAQAQAAVTAASRLTSPSP